MSKHAIKLLGVELVQTQLQSVTNFQMYINRYKPSESSKQLDVASQLFIVGLRAFLMNLGRRFLNHATSFPTSYATTYFIN